MLILKINDKYYSKLIEYVCICNYNLTNARYSIIHIEKFIIDTYYLINNLI